MNASAGLISWHGLEARVLENGVIRTVVLPTLGAKLVSLFDKRTAREWLAGPGDRPLRHVPYGAVFTEQDMSGWDEMLPTIVACDYPAPGERHGRALPDHGEVWSLPWQLESSSPDELRLSVTGKALPYRLTRTLSFCADDTLQLVYELTNLGVESMPFLWAAHPQFACGGEAEVVLPAGVNEVLNALPPEWGWGEPETRFGWPVATGADGQASRIDLTGPPALKRARKFFVEPETTIGWAGLIRRPESDWLRLDWDSAMASYLGIWVDEGALNHQTVVALEPMNGFYDSLALAWENHRVATLAAGQTRSWSLTARLGTGELPFPADDRS